jgi:hypothetical protein
MSSPVLGQLNYSKDGGWAEPIQFPLVLDTKVLSCVAVLFTILAKSNTIAREHVQVRKSSKITLSSSFGLASPGDIYNHIDYILGGMQTLRNFFSSLNVMPEEEQNALATNIKARATLSYNAGNGLEGLRHGRYQATRFLSEPENAAYACAFAWSLVESATCIIWLVTYLATGLSPVAYPTRYAPPPSEGVEGLSYLLSLSFRQWLDYESLIANVEGRGIRNIELKLLSQLVHGEATLTKKLIACKSMIRDSPNFRSNYDVR